MVHGVIGNKFCQVCGSYYAHDRATCPVCLQALIEKSDRDAGKFTADGSPQVAEPRRHTREVGPRLAEFEQHEQHVKERMVTYGHPKQNFRRIATMKLVIADCRHLEARHALEMIVEAVARLIECPEHVDSWSNIAGYARCGIMVTEPPLPQKET